MLDVRCEVHSACALGEGPLWDDRNEALWWVDILNSQLHRYSPATGKHSVLDQQPALTSIVKRGRGGFAATQPNQFVLLDEQAGVVEGFGAVEPDLPNNRFNDGKVDPAGRFWAGTMDDELRYPRGALYCLEDGQCCRHDRDYIVSNGPAFSPDGACMYHTDSARGTIYRYAVDRRGQLSERVPLVVIPEQEGRPDGMTVDREGNLWVAHFAGWRISRFTAAGKKIDHIPMPVSCVTSCTFGGADFSTLYITTAAVTVTTVEQRAREPLAGALFSIKTGTSGFPSFSYAG